MRELSPEAEARDMEPAQGGPRKSGLQLLWGKEERRNERAFAGGGSEGYGACDDVFHVKHSGRRLL